MSASSRTPESTESNTRQASLRTVETAIAAAPLDRLARGTGKDEGYLCNVRKGTAGLKLHEFVALLDAAGLKVVNVNQFSVHRDRFEAMATIASAAMADPEIARRLTLDE